MKAENTFFLGVGLEGSKERVEGELEDERVDGEVPEAFRRRAEKGEKRCQGSPKLEAGFPAVEASRGRFGGRERSR